MCVDIVCVAYLLMARCCFAASAGVLHPITVLLSSACSATAILAAVQMYKNTGLIGLLGTTAGSTAAAADALTAKLKGLASATGDAQLAAAKQHALTGYQSAISARSGVVQDMGLQLLARGKFSAQEYAAAVSGLTSADVSKYVGEVLKTPLTLVAVGGLSSLPKYDTVAGKLLA